MLVPAHRRPHPPTHPPTYHPIPSYVQFVSGQTILDYYSLSGISAWGWLGIEAAFVAGGYACRSISSVWGSDLKCAAIWWGMAGSGWAEGHPGLLVSGSRTGCTSLTLLLVSAHLLALPPPSLPPLRSRPGPARWFAHHPPVAPTHHTPLCSSLFAVFFGFAFLALKYVSHVRR